MAGTLRAAITKEALVQAIDQAGEILPDTLIHHSDRGVKYCCNEYVETLRRHHIRISMTEDSNPTDNAIAERTNGIIKGESVYPREPFNTLEQTRNVIGRYIHFYNNRRPHMSIGYKVPALVHMETGPQKKMWKNKIYKKKESINENNRIPLSCQTTSPESCLSIFTEV